VQVGMVRKKAIQLTLAMDFLGEELQKSKE
jgi:hypothetical protein